MAKSSKQTSGAKRPVLGSSRKTKTGKTKQTALSSKDKKKKQTSNKKVETKIVGTPPYDETLRIKRIYYERESVEEYNYVRKKNGIIEHKYLRKKAGDRLDLEEGNLVVFPLCCIGPQTPYVGRIAKITTTKTGRIETAVAVILGHKEAPFEFGGGKVRGDTHKIDLCLTYTVSPVNSYDTKEIKYDFRGGPNFEEMTVEELKSYVKSHPPK